MGKATFVQTSFNGGEFSLYAQGRYDHANYRKGLALCFNSYPMVQGAWTRRPGTQLAGLTRGGAAAGLLPFSFEGNVQYTVEMTDGHFRFFQGSTLVMDGTNAVVSAISAAKPAVLTLATAPDWASGNQIQFTGDMTAAAGLPTLFNRVFQLTGSATIFSLADAVTGLPIDGSLLTLVGTLTANRVLDLASPYSGVAWSSVRGVQNETNMVLMDGASSPQLLAAVPPAGLTSAQFSIAPAALKDGPYLDPVPTSYVTPDALTGLVNLTLSNPVYSATVAYSVGDYVSSSGITYVSILDANLNNTPASSPTAWTVSFPGAAIGPSGFVQTDIGRHVRLFSEPPDWDTATTYTTGQVVKYADQYWAALAGMTGATPAAGSINPNQPGNLTTTWALNPSAAQWSWGKIVSLPTSGLINPNAATVFSFACNSPAAAFDGNLSQVSTSCANLGANGTASAIGLSLGSGQAILSATIYPSTDRGFGVNWNAGVTAQLRGSNTVPVAFNSGTVLGTKTIPGTSQVAGAPPISIQSNNTVTTYAYVWISLTQQASSGAAQIWFSEARFFSTGAGQVGSVAQIQLIGAPLLYTTQMKTWRLGLYSDTNAIWPSCGCYHEGRLWLAGASPNRFDTSRSNDFLNFSPTDPDGSVPDDAGISYIFNSSDLNRIYWLKPDLQGVIAGTIGGEWIIDSPSSSSAGFAPTNCRARRVTTYGCASVEPVNTGMTTVFVQRYKRKVHEFMADAYSGKFIGPELSELDRQAVQGSVSRLVYQSGVDPIVWVLNEDGSLSGATYRRTSMISTQPPEVLAWHRHELGSTHRVTWISKSSSADGLLDTVALVTRDGNTGLYQVEVLGNTLAEDDTIFDANLLDSAITPSSATSDATNYYFYGLWPLNGDTVTAWIAGLDCGDFTVTNGSITVPKGSAGGLLTDRWLTQLQALGLEYAVGTVTLASTNVVVPAVVGFTFTSRGQLLRPVAQDQTGSALGPAFAKIRRQDHYGVQLVNSQGLYVGTDFAKLRPSLFETKGGRRYSPLELYSGIHWGTLDDGYSFDSQLCWEISRPYPAVVTAIGGFPGTDN